MRMKVRFEKPEFTEVMPMFLVGVMILVFAFIIAAAYGYDHIKYLF